MIKDSELQELARQHRRRGFHNTQSAPTDAPVTKHSATTPASPATPAIITDLLKTPNTANYLLTLCNWLLRESQNQSDAGSAFAEPQKCVPTFAAMLHRWGADLRFRGIQETSNVRELYAAQIFEGISDTCIPVGVIHEESHHSNQTDMIFVCAIARAIKAKRIFEFGTYRGQTTCGLASDPEVEMVFTLNLPIDHASRYAPYIGSFIASSPFKDRISQIYADSRTFDVAPFAHSIDMVFVDADHSYEAARNDTEKALDLIRPGGAIIWHDYAAKSPGVLRFIQEFAQDRPVFRIRRTPLVIYLDGVDALSFTPLPMPASLEDAEYGPGSLGHHPVA